MKAVSGMIELAASALRAQSSRMRVIAENVANANSTAKEPGGAPYRRKVAVFEAELDRVMNIEMVKMSKARPDRSDFETRYEPGHPAADPDGYVKYPNVNPLVEMMDMRAASRAYQANLNVIENARSMLARTLDLLRR